jgi:hypothetical protein
VDVHLIADEEEDEDVHSLRHATGDRLGSSATKRRSRQIFKSPPKKVKCMNIEINVFVNDTTIAISMNNVRLVFIFVIHERAY